MAYINVTIDPNAQIYTPAQASQRGKRGLCKLGGDKVKVVIDGENEVYRWRVEDLSVKMDKTLSDALTEYYDGIRNDGIVIYKG